MLTKKELIKIGNDHGYKGEYIFMRHEDLAHTIDELIRSKGYKSIFNVGCGLGIMEHFMEENVDIYGIDIDEQELQTAIKLAKKGNRPNFVYEKQDIYDLHIDKKFDIIIASELIEHIEGDDKLLNELKQYLSPNGVMIITVPNKWQPRNRLRGFAGMDLAIMDPTHLREYSDKHARRVFESVNLTVQEKRVSVLYFPLEKYIKKIFPPRSIVRRWILKVMPNFASHFIYILKNKK